MAKRRKRQANPGAELRAMRQQLGLSFRDVYAASLDIAEQCRQPAFEIAPSRLHEIESKNMIPSIHRLHALALIYRRTMNELLSLYGIEPSDRTSMELIRNEGVNETKQRNCDQERTVKSHCISSING